MIVGMPLLMRSRHVACLLICLFACLSTTAQTPAVAPPPKPAKQTVLLIPFNPKLYISEADRNINRETKLTFKQIVHAFRKNLEGVIGNQFKTSFTVISMMKDTAKTGKDLSVIYNSVSYNYDMVPTGTQLIPPKEVKTGNGPRDGQLERSSQGAEKRFMNTKINSPGLLAQLGKKYKADIFVFVNELDIRATTEFDEATQSYKRDVAVHYTVVDKEGKMLCAGLAETACPASENNPEKIANKYFTAIAKTIFDRTQKALAVKP